MANNIKIFKLITGEEIMAELLGQDSLGVRFKNAVRIVIMPGKTMSDANVGLAPWSQFSSDVDLVIDKSHIICILTPIQEFVNQYNSMFGGIVSPSKKLII